jgi:hypothetical protein
LRFSWEMEEKVEGEMAREGLSGNSGAGELVGSGRKGRWGFALNGERGVGGKW